MRLATIVALALGLSGCDAVFGLDRDKQWLDGYGFRKTITITPNLVADVDDVPISVIADQDPDILAHALPDGADLAFAAGDGTVLDSELVTYDPAAGGIEAWVRIPSLPGREISAEVFLYYGGKPRSAIASSTWPARFAGVWHMSEKAAIEHDSTSHARHPSGNAAPDRTKGIVGFARDFSAASDGPNSESLSLAPESFNFGMGSFAYSMWVLAPDQQDDYDSPFYKGGSSATPGYCVLLGKGAWNADVVDGTTPLALSFSNAPITDRWVQLGVILDRTANKFEVYLDGALTASTVLMGFGSPDSQDRFQVSGSTYPFLGALDEVRVYDGVPPPGWFAVEYANLFQRAQFMRLGDEEKR